MITTKTCSTCEHFPNDHHCVGCVWDEDKGENTKWELKKNPIVIERAVLDKIRAEIEQKIEQERFARSVFRGEEKDTVKAEQCTGSIFAYNNVIKLIDKYMVESGV